METDFLQFSFTMCWCFFECVGLDRLLCVVDSLSSSFNDSLNCRAAPSSLPLPYPFTCCIELPFKPCFKGTRNIFKIIQENDCNFMCLRPALHLIIWIHYMFLESHCFMTSSFHSKLHMNKLFTFFEQTKNLEWKLELMELWL